MTVASHWINENVISNLKPGPTGNEIFRLRKKGNKQIERNTEKSEAKKK